jgi:hypothetical protein
MVFRLSLCFGALNVTMSGIDISVPMPFHAQIDETFSGGLRFAGPLAQTATLGVLHDTISSDRFSRRRGQHAGRQ